MRKCEKISLTLVIIVIAMLTIFFGIRKNNYHCDELWTYGLANHMNGIKPEYEVGKTYSGTEIYDDFFEVKSGHAFNYLNVWKNQAKDVHPPFYYAFIHTVCSVFANSFSKWYGIGVNIFWMILTMILLFKLVKSISDSSISATGIALAYGSSVLYLDTMILIRMYAQFTFFAVALAYLFKTYWVKSLDRKFYIKLGLIAFFGMLSHYYFLIYAFAMCMMFGINIIFRKNISEIKGYVITLGASGLVYGVVWYHIIAHIFNGYRGEEALSKMSTFNHIFDGAINLFGIINDEVFAGTILFFIAFSIVYLIISVKRHTLKINFELCLFVCSIFYVLIVGKIAPSALSRYVMSIGWIFTLSAYIILKKLCETITTNKTFEYGLIAVFLIINVFNLYNRGWIIPMDYSTPEFNKAVKEAEGKEAVVYIDNNFKILYDYEVLKKTDSYSIEDKDTVEKALESKNKDYILIIDVDDGREEIIENLNSELLYCFQNSYFYLIHK